MVPVGARLAVPEAVMEARDSGHGPPYGGCSCSSKGFDWIRRCAYPDGTNGSTTHPRQENPMPHKPLKLFVLDFNWVRDGERSMRPSMPHELAWADPGEFVRWHLDMGCNVLFQHAYTFNGCAWYPSKLGPCVPEPGTRFLTTVLELAHDAGLPFHSYFCVGQDRFVSANRQDWVVPNSHAVGVGMLAPESGWTDLLCRRIEEFLAVAPADANLFDWVV
jgi:hypothetical protein